MRKIDNDNHDEDNLHFTFKNFYIVMTSLGKIILTHKMAQENAYTSSSISYNNITMAEIIKQNGKIYWGKESNIDKIIEYEADRPFDSIIINDILQLTKYNSEEIPY